MSHIHISDIEAAINWWRERTPSADGVRVCAEVEALAEVYALLAYQHADRCAEDQLPQPAMAAWLAWYASTPDAPCIAICSTTQGDPVCKGCGRTFEEVQHWLAMTPVEKRAVWRRIVLDGSAWRFNRYAERTGSASADSA